MIRTFQPIGQGTFVTEQFGHGQNVVFDCGSVHSEEWTKQLVETNFYEGELIDGVFLSAIDREHAGGLKALMDWCRVQKVFVPYLEAQERAATLLKYLCEGGEPDDFLANLIAEPKTALSAYQILDCRLPILTQVSQETDREKNVFDKIMPMYLMPWKAVEGFRVFVDEEMDWLYQPQVYRQQAPIEQLTASLTAIGADPGWIRSVETIKRGWRQTPIRKELRQAYDRVDKPFCPATLAVYSGPEKQDYPMYEQFTEKGRWANQIPIHCGCLYTGDLHFREEAIRQRFLQKFHRYRPLTGSLLLPGHGEERMFHQEILPKHAGIVVAGADNENKQCLPHGSVVRSIMDRRIPFYLVTELPGSTLRFAIGETAR